MTERRGDSTLRNMLSANHRNINMHLTPMTAIQDGPGGLEPPMSMRGDLGYPGPMGGSGGATRLAFNQPQIANQNDGPTAGGAQDVQAVDDAPTNYISGTKISMTNVGSTFNKFIDEFDIDSAGDVSISEDNNGLYVRQLRRLYRERGSTSFPIDADHLFQYNKELYETMVNFPIDVISRMDTIIYRTAMRIFDEAADMTDEDGNNMQVEPVEDSFTVRIKNLRSTEHRRMRDMNPSDIEKLVAISGIVIRVSELIPDMIVASFNCTTDGCDNTRIVRLEASKIEEPTVCEKCNGRLTFQLNHNDCTYKDKQIVKLQETPESMPEGETPQTLMVYVYDHLYDSVRPGDRIEATGIYRAKEIRIRPTMRATKTVYRTFIDVLHFDRTKAAGGKSILSSEEAESHGESIASRKAVEDLEREVRTTVGKYGSHQMQEKLVQSFAPNIWEYEDVKKGLLCQLFGGAEKSFSQSGRGRFRGEINLLLCGDPSTAKSQFLQYVHKTAPRGVYTSGKGSSAVGLTAYISRDPDTRDLVLESGALVLSDRGICCIDEFDKMDDSTRAILHEVMEQQTVSVAKSGIVCSLNARTAICASANPVASRYDPRKSVVENINLAPSMLSRFDLMYLVLDKNTELNDRRLANHIIRIYDGKTMAQFTPPLSHDELTKYISYARNHLPQPIISDEAREELINGYCNMRNNPATASVGMNKNTIQVTLRQLESLIRISEALCKMELEGLVTKRHVLEAIRLTKQALYITNTDPITGLITNASN